MKKTLFLLLLLVFLSCEKSKEIDGLWIGEYQTTSSRLHLYAEQSALSFEGGICFYKNFKHKEPQILKGKLVNKNNTVIFDSDEKLRFKVLNTQKDSLIIKFKDSIPFMVYRKLSNELKHKQDIDLLNKTFVLKNKHFTDTVSFNNNNELLRNSMVNKKLSWERETFKGFDILMLNNDIPYIITKQSEDTIYLTSVLKESINHTLIEIKNR